MVARVADGLFEPFGPTITSDIGPKFIDFKRRSILRNRELTYAIRYKDNPPQYGINPYP
jgi:hypothetical protein